MIAFPILDVWCGVLSEIFGIIAIGAKVWSTEPGRAKATIASGAIGLLCSVLTMAWRYAMFGKFQRAEKPPGPRRCRPPGTADRRGLKSARRGPHLIVKAVS